MNQSQNQTGPVGTQNLTNALLISLTAMLAGGTLIMIQRGYQFTISDNEQNGASIFFSLYPAMGNTSAYKTLKVTDPANLNGRTKAGKLWNKVKKHIEEQTANYPVK